MIAEMVFAMEGRRRCRLFTVACLGGSRTRLVVAEVAFLQVGGHVSAFVVAVEVGDAAKRFLCATWDQAGVFLFSGLVSELISLRGQPLRGVENGLE